MSKLGLNPNIKMRDEIIFGEYSKENYVANEREFFDLQLSQLEKLISNNFISNVESHNESPTTSEFLEFMKLYPEYKAIGFVISDQREDYRVTITGLQKESGAETIEELKDFVMLCRCADVFSVEGKMYSNWD